ncbi:MAG: glycosyltransferase [Lutibacter sp.]
MKQKKIVFKVPEFPHLSETFIVAQIVTALKLGYEVEILIRKLVESGIDLNSGLIEKYCLIDKIIIEDYKIPKNKIIRLFKWMMLLIINFKDVNYILKFYKEYNKFSLTWLYQWHFYKQFNEAAIIHIQYGTNKYPIDILKKIGFFKPSVIATFHGHDAFFPINGFIPNNGYYDNLFNYGNLITANTPYLAEEILGLGCPKELLSIVPVGVNTDFFYPNNKKNRNKTLSLITVGRLDKVKGHQYCIEAVKQLIKNGFDVDLTIIGEGTEHNNLKNLIAEYKLDDKIFMKGSKSQQEVRQALREHDVYLLTAVALPNGRRETQGLATLEAQACGLPVIVFDSGGVKYTLKDRVSGFVCEEYDVEDVVAKIIKFMESSNLLTKMSNEAVTFVNENYSQKIIDGKWENIYRNLSNGK